MAKKTLIVVVGPTAVGKTDFCIQLAQEYKMDVVSADSRQFYKEMAIGTAKPTKKEIKNVTHHLIDHISIHDRYTVADYEKEALSCLKTIFKTSNTALLTGGSGLFVRAVCEGFDEMPSITPGVRESLNELHKQSGIAVLLDELAQTDPEYFQQVDKNNYVRVIRALEVIRSTGHTFSSYRSGKKAKRDFDIIKIGLNRERSELYDRINHRMDIMLSNGLIEEAKNLYPFKDLASLKTVGYQELFDFWDGKYNWANTIERLKQNSRRYAKRQLTWFRKDPEINWFHPNDLALVKKKLMALGV